MNRLTLALDPENPSRRLWRAGWAMMSSLLALAGSGHSDAQPAVALPEGVQAVWEMDKAHREATATRERICLNGLWQWQPSDSNENRIPDGDWGYFKVPGCWPGITDYMQKDCQTVHAHPSWKTRPLGTVSAAWHQRELTVPREWTGRRIALQIDYLNSYAVVHIDGQRAGELHFPGGELEITDYCRPGATHHLAVWVLALPLKAVLLSYTDSASAREAKGTVARRGLCGDIFLVSTPPRTRILDVRVDTSVRRQEVTCAAAMHGLARDQVYRLRTRIAAGAHNATSFTSPPFGGGDLAEGRFAFTQIWMPDRLWDIHTPHHTLALECSLLDADGNILDTAWPVRFGFREFWIEGRDFYLNGTRLFLSALPLDNAQVGAALATYGAARESLKRLQSFGINCVYTHNYGCEPGSHLGFEEILRAADDAGMLVAFSQPHFSHYDWPGAGADATNGYARHAAYYVRAAQNHPSVVMYSMSHNATGYHDDMNPDFIDGVREARDTWALRNAEKALRAEAIVRRLDPSRIVYHHASGNLGSMHPVNFYPNFAPAQELSDWFEHWATAGVKPVFTCEYGAPFTWDWTMYRGWYNGQREFGSAAVPWEFCLAEWNAQFLGDRAFDISEPEKANLRWEARQLRAGRVWHRWDYPHQVGSTRFDERYPVFALYLTDNWRAFRTWGVSAISPWEHGHFWKLRDGVDRRRRDLPVDWDTLQRPGFSPDFIDQRYERMDLAFERADWIATPAAEALIRNNRPLLAYLAGKPARFTSKDHNFLPGEIVEKQMIVINNTRESVTCQCQWSCNLPQAVSARQQVVVAAGQQERLALRCPLPPGVPRGQYDLVARFQFGTGETQEDRFLLHVLPPEPSPIGADPGRGESLPATTLDSGSPAADPLPATIPESESARPRVALFDPKGQTQASLKRLGWHPHPVQAETDLSAFDILIVGKEALSVDGPAPDIRRVRDGLKVIVFEQTSEALEQRLGFRVQEYGLRQLFPRVPDHPVLTGLATEHLRDWRGEATILPPRLKPEMRPRHGPTVQWCGLPVTRLWRCGNQGNVASVLIEKPARGDFLPILDGGYSLQYSPLLEHRDNQGLVLFCQVDVTGRTEDEPAAEILVRNLLRYVSAWKPPARRSVVYAGDPPGRSHLESVGIAAPTFDGLSLAPGALLVVGRGGGAALAPHQAAIADWLQAGGRVLGVGLGQEDLDAWLPVVVTTRKAEHIAAFFEPFAHRSPFAGVGPADVHNRDPRDVPLVTDGARPVGNGVLALHDRAPIVLCQLAPWEFIPAAQPNLRRTHRRLSCLLSRLLGNLGVRASTPVLDRFHRPVARASEERWLDGLYLDRPEEWDDPYRFFRW